MGGGANDGTHEGITAAVTSLAGAGRVGHAGGPSLASKRGALREVGKRGIAARGPGAGGFGETDCDVNGEAVAVSLENMLGSGDSDPTPKTAEATDCDADGWGRSFLSAAGSGLDRIDGADVAVFPDQIFPVRHRLWQ